MRKSVRLFYSPDDIGKLVWSSGTTHRFWVWGPYLIADDKFYIFE